MPLSPLDRKIYSYSREELLAMVPRRIKTDKDRELSEAIGSALLRKTRAKGCNDMFNLPDKADIIARTEIPISNCQAAFFRDWSAPDLDDLIGI